MKKVALYPGSFDPITYGHIDIINRATVIFDEVIISIFDNPDKKPLFSFSKRKELILSALNSNKNIKVDSFNGLLANYSRIKSIKTIIRGLRAVSDFDYEFQMALTNRHLAKDLDTVFFMTDQKYSYLSSSLVKQLCRFGGDVSNFVPTIVQESLRSYYNE